MLSGYSFAEIKRPIIAIDKVSNVTIKERLLPIISQAEKMLRSKLRVFIATAYFNFDKSAACFLTYGKTDRGLFSIRECNMVTIRMMIIIPEVFIDKLSDRELLAFIISEFFLCPAYAIFGSFLNNMIFYSDRLLSVYDSDRKTTRYMKEKSSLLSALEKILVKSEHRFTNQKRKQRFIKLLSKRINCIKSPNFTALTALSEPEIKFEAEYESKD